MDKLLKFMEMSVIDPQLYWRIPSQDGKYLYEVQWRREDKSRWRMRKVGDVLWELSTEETLVGDLNSRGIDLYLFEIKLRNSLLQQVTFADRIVRDAKKLFGQSEVEKAVYEHTSFLLQLEDAILHLTQEGKKAERPKLRVVAQQDQLQ